MELEMRYIDKIWKEKSFSKAAEELYITQPALSLAVKRIEEKLGAEIFDRKQRPLELTDTGKAYISMIRHIQVIEDELQREVQDIHDAKKGTVRIGGTHFLTCYILAFVLAGFAAEHPDVNISIFEDAPNKVYDKLLKRELDVTFSCDPKVVEQFEHRPAFSDQILLAVHSNTALPKEADAFSMSSADIVLGRHKDPDCPKAKLSMFRDLEFILLQPGTNLNFRSYEMFRAAGFEPKVKLSLSQLVTACRLADNGLGATFISDRLVRSRKSNLRYFNIDSPLTTREFYYLMPKRYYTPFAVKAFIEYTDKNLV